MRYARIENNQVAEIGEFDSIDGRFHPSLVWIESDVAELGDTWDGTTFAKPAPLPPEVPERVQMYQARLALLGAGLLDTVEATIAGMSGVEGKAAQIEREFSPILKRAHPLVLALGPSLGLTDAQLDELFIQAAAI